MGTRTAAAARAGMIAAACVVGALFTLVVTMLLALSAGSDDQGHGYMQVFLGFLAVVLGIVLMPLLDGVYSIVRSRPSTYFCRMGGGVIVGLCGLLFSDILQFVLVAVGALLIAFAAIGLVRDLTRHSPQRGTGRGL